MTPDQEAREFERWLDKRISFLFRFVVVLLMVAPWFMLLCAGLAARDQAEAPITVEAEER